MKKLRLMNKLAFTLAEVLITLGIIGVIAAMTIPTLLNKTNDAELIAAYKKDSSIVYSAFAGVLQDNGGNINGIFAGDGAGSEAFKEAIKSHLSYIKDCSGTSAFGGVGNGISVDGCWRRANQWCDINNNLMTDRTNPGLILADGSFLSIGINATDCSKDMSSANYNYTRCGYIGFDVNGNKGPNTIGKDIFSFSVLPNRVIPEGTMPIDPSKVCTPPYMNGGYDCSAKYLLLP